MQTIRLIQPQDDAQIAQLIRTTLVDYDLAQAGTAYDDPELDHLSQYYLADPQRRAYYVAETARGEFLGGIGFSEFAALAECVEVQKLYLDPAAQGQGIGRALLARLEYEAQSRGYRRLYLETHSRLTAALKFYAKHSFYEIDRPAGVIHSSMDRFFMKEL